jgi:indolepyruvate ferredoxin oxidoreductase
VRDLRAGLNTAGYISGYRGSPLGGLDQTLFRARSHLEKHHVKFQPGINEDLAATAIWGTQQVGMFPGARYDGVFAMWYGKGPGVDRCGDVFKHANAAGTSKHGGVPGTGGGRPRREIVDAPAPERAHPQGVLHPGSSTRPSVQSTSTLGCTASR